jgi:hypothetical protein
MAGAMTLGRLNLTDPVPVIDRTDDSSEAPIRVAVLGVREFLVSVLIEPIRRSGFTTWWADRPGGGEPSAHDPDLFPRSLGTDDSSQQVHGLTRRIAAGEQRSTARVRRDRANQAHAVRNATRDSSILMMRHDPDPAEDGIAMGGVASRADGDSTAARGDNGGRQQW